VKFCANGSVGCSRAKIMGILQEKCKYEYVSKNLEQRFSNCGPRTTSGPRVMPLWSF